MTPVPVTARTLLAVSLGGALGAVLRHLLGQAVPDGGGFPWTTFAINVSGSAVLAALPLVGAVRRRPLVAVGLGPGLLGGYTTLSAASEQTRALLADQPLVGAAYALATLVACLVVVDVVRRRETAAAVAEFEAEGGDE